MSERRQIRTTCNRDCPDSCAILVTVEGGRIVEHRADPDHGITRGVLCQRGNAYLRRFYHRDRILHPLRRAKHGWQRVSWDDALDLAAEQLTRLRDELGATSVLACSYSGIKGLVTKSLWQRFWGHFGGATFLEGGTSVEAAHAGQQQDFGRDATHAPEDLLDSRAIVIWGKNIEVTRPHTMAFVRRARQVGAELHVIDPVRCLTARKADHSYQLRPGSDAWLALGIGRLLLEHDTVDRDFIAAHCAGFEGYAELLRSISIDDVVSETDLTLAQVEALARLYGETKPLATLIGLGPAYWRHAAQNVRLIDALVAISGNLGRPGGGAHTDTSAGYAGLDLEPLKGGPRGERRQILLPLLGERLAELRDPPIRGAWIAGANPAATCPDTQRVAAALAQLDFCVVVDQFLTASAEHAQLLLPCTTYLEMDDLVVAYGHDWLGVTQQTVPPEGEARSDVAILQGLAERLGFGAALAGEPRAWADRLLGPLEGIDFASLTRCPTRNPLAGKLPFADGRYATPSGKVELLTELAGPDRASLREGELHLVATKTLLMVNAQITAEDRPTAPVVRLHPETLAARGLDAEGDIVSPNGRRLRVRFVADATVRRDVALFNPAAWQGDLQGVNQLRQAIMTDAGQAAAMHETRVTLEPATAAP